MARFTTKLFAAFAAAVTLSACDGGSSRDELMTFLPEAEAAEATIQRIAGDEFEEIDPLPGSAFVAIPDTGIAVFTGPGRVDIFSRSVTGAAGLTQTTDETVIGLQGEARISVDFAASTFSGTMDDFTALDPEDLSIADAAGSLSIEGGVGTGVPNDLGGSFTGTITAFDEEYVLSGGLEGKLRGTRVDPGERSPIKALSLTGEDQEIAGRDLLADIVIVGETP